MNKALITKMFTDIRYDFEVPPSVSLRDFAEAFGGQCTEIFGISFYGAAGAVSLTLNFEEDGTLYDIHDNTVGFTQVEFDETGLIWDIAEVVTQQLLSRHTDFRAVLGYQQIAFGDEEPGDPEASHGWVKYFESVFEDAY